MTIDEAAKVLRKLIAFQPNTPRDEFTINAWSEALANYDVDDLLDAVTKVCCAPRPENEPFLVELRHLLAEVNTVRRRRFDARRALLPEPPVEVADDPAAYRDWWAATAKAAMRRDWTAPPAIEGTRSAAPAIESALAALPTLEARP